MFPLSGCPIEDKPRMSIARVQEDRTDYDSNESIKVEYDRTDLFLLTRWLQDHRGEQVTHKMYCEFSKLCTEVQSELIHKTEDRRGIDVHDSVVLPVEEAVMRLWDLGGELKPWVVKESCKVLLGTTSPNNLPQADPKTYERETEFRGGMASHEMAFANIGDAFLGGGKSYTEEEMNEAEESGQGKVDYDYNLENYRKP